MVVSFVLFCFASFNFFLTYVKLHYFQLQVEKYPDKDVKNSCGKEPPQNEVLETFLWLSITPSTAAEVPPILPELIHTTGDLLLEGPICFSIWSHLTSPLLFPFVLFCLFVYLFSEEDQSQDTIIQLFWVQVIYWTW